MRKTSGSRSDVADIAERKLVPERGQLGRRSARRRRRTESGPQHGSDGVHW